MLLQVIVTSYNTIAYIVNVFAPFEWKLTIVPPSPRCHPFQLELHIVKILLFYDTQIYLLILTSHI